MQLARRLALLVTTSLTSLAGDTTAQTLDTTIVTESVRVGPFSPPHTEHARPLSYLTYLAPAPIPTAATVQHTATLDFDVTLTNTTGAPVSGALEVLAENTYVVGGTSPSFYCWGNSASTSPWVVRAGLVVAPGASLHVTGAFTFPGSTAHSVPAPSSAIYQSNGCTSDGLHVSGGASNLSAGPSSIQAFRFNDTGGLGLVDVVDNGSSFTNELTVESRYRLSLLAGSAACGSANPNSSGAFGVLEAYGTPGPSGLVVLAARSLPAGSLGYWLIGASGQAATPMGSGLGSLCLASPVQRWSQTAGLTDPNGARQLQVPAGTLVTPNVVLSLGSTWHFQYWHRDFVGGAATSNTTSSVVVTF